jgi:osomolarity two-component system response regulator SSK1
MGDFRSKLRARISRRHSGIPPLPSSRNGNASSNSTKSVEPSSPASAHRVEIAETVAAVPENQDASLTRQATGSSQGQLKQASKQQPARVIAAEVSDASSGRDDDDAAGFGSAAVSQNPNSATNSSPPLPASPSPGKTDSLGSDRRILTASEPLSGNKNPVDAVQQSSSSSPPSPTTRSAPVKPKTPRVSTDVARRARVGDPPVSSDPSSPASRPAVSGRRSFTSQEPVDPSLSLQLRPSNPPSPRPPAPPRRQSLLPNRQTSLIRTLLNAGQTDDLDQGASEQLPPINPKMVTRKLWVKRPGASATLVTINEEDLVDDVRELILRKYGNTLGRQFDAPDLTLRIVPRETQRQERILGPEEPMARTLDAYFPGGQSVDEALLIDVPHRRTPRVSPRNGPPHAQHLTSVSYEDMRPLEGSTDYFGPGAVAHIPVTIAGAANGTTHSISVLNTGQVPQIPSPGGTSRTRPYRDRPDRPRLGRQHTSSPTILNVVGAGGHTATIAVATGHGMQQASSITRSRTHSNASSEQANAGQPAPPAPIPRTATPPPPRAASPRPPANRPKKKKTTEAPALPAGMLNGGVPPINVLIVEDNIINLRLLEAFVKRLKVRWQTAMNGRDAVTKWRAGGFHLVLMDIQLPVMSGLEATREIRRLERTNSIGAFSNANNNSNNTNGGEPDESKQEMPKEDKLENREMFKSPVIIVALTASSLQSDRHEALAAGCNDFLTKPVTYVWLERKVMEWGCMQALIDYDGWRKWKSYT